MEAKLPVTKDDYLTTKTSSLNDKNVVVCVERNVKYDESNDNVASEGDSEAKDDSIASIRIDIQKFSNGSDKKSPLRRHLCSEKKDNTIRSVSANERTRRIARKEVKYTSPIIAKLSPTMSPKSKKLQKRSQVNKIQVKKVSNSDKNIKDRSFTQSPSIVKKS